MKKIMFVSVVALSSGVGYAYDFDDEVNAMRTAMSAKMSAGRRISTAAPGDQVTKLRGKRGGPSAVQNNTPCGGVSIGNITTSPTDKGKKSTTVIINGSILNMNNEC